MFKDVSEKHLPLEACTRVLVALQKPGKLLDHLKSIRPIVPLTNLQKTLFLITLHRRGHRRGHRGFAAKCHRYIYIFEILSIDLSRAFDTIRRKKLLDILHSFINTDNIVRIIRLLFLETKITVRIDDAMSVPFILTSALHRGTLCRRYSSLCTSKQPFRRCADVFQADHQLTTTYPARGYTQTTPTSSQLTMTT